MKTTTDVLVLHEGELRDVTALLDRLEIFWVEGRSAQYIAGTPGLVIGTPQQLLRFRRAGESHAVAHVAVCQGAGRALERKLEEEGVDFILRRPIHPVALRLLILHLVYRGPERRRLRRVSAGVPLKFRTGLRSRRGLLLEFSVGGCQLLTDVPLSVGQRIRVTLPTELGLGRKLAIKGRVARSQEASAGSKDEFVAAIDFGELTPDTRQRLAAGVVARAHHRPPPPQAAHSEATPDEAEVQLRERRQGPRGPYTKAVHGRLADDQVVLMGSNLSKYGMQVDPEPRLALGMKLKLDLYGHGDIPPLRLDAEVARDDGARGWYLEFVNLWPGAPALLERLVKTLPLATPGPEGSGIVISEVIERRRVPGQATPPRRGD